MIARDRYAPPVASNPPDEHAEPVVVGGYSDTGEAEVAQAKLRAFGIESVIVDRVEGGTIMVVDEGGVGLEVRAADAEDARAILADSGGDEADEAGAG